MNFLPDLRGWALSGGAGENEDSNGQENENNESEPIQQETEEEIRAKRLARLSGRPNNTVETNTAGSSMNESMEVDTTNETGEKGKTETTTAADTSNNDCQTAATPSVAEVAKPSSSPTKDESNDLNKTAIKKASVETLEGPLAKKKRGKEHLGILDPGRKLQRKKEMLIIRVLNIKLTGGCVSSSDCIEIDIGTSVITEENIAEILASRLSLTSNDLQSASSKERSLIAYLASCHKKASEEFKNTKPDNTTGTEEVRSVLEEIKRQVVSFAASSLMEPDLFELGQDGPSQLATCLSAATLDPAASITLGLSGKNSSFFACLCEELNNQDSAVFESVIKDVVLKISESLKKCETVLDSTGESGLVQVSALTSLCSVKKAAAAVTKVQNFLLPPADSPQSAERVSAPIPQIPAGATQQQQSIFRMMAAMSQGSQGYLRRSGPGLEKETLLGLVMRLGTPMDSPAITSQFQNAAGRSRTDVKKSTSTLRRQLKIYQDSVYALVKALITAGEEARTPVMQWFTDALLVNVGANALRPDKTKVSNTQTLQNISIVLLKLCEPFMKDASRIHPGFVSSPEHHGGIFVSTGDNAIPRLSENTDSSQEPYNPKNTFIPMCFFLCVRSLHLGAVANSAYHSNIVRQVNHMAWNLRQRNSDVMSDPQFNHVLSMQFANEVSLLSTDAVVDILRFFNLSAGFLLQIDDKALPLMPEHMVEDICSFVVFVTRFAAADLQSVELGNVFKCVVKLLSPKYASTVRNYNLRAKLGDVLHDVYLPPDRDSSVPSSISCDPKAGGRPYLLSDTSSQETLAPSLLLLYGEVEHTGYYEKMIHRANIASLLQYLWESKEHRLAFRRITQNKDSFIKFANGIMNEMNSLIANVMEKLPEIRTVQVQMSNSAEWNALSEEERETISSRHEENEDAVKRALPLCNKTLKMLGFLSTDTDIRSLFLLEEMCPRLVNMLLHVMTKLVGARGMELKVSVV